MSARLKRYALAFVAVALLTLFVDSLRHPEWWWTADQRGDRLLRQEKYTEAAATYDGPLRQGVALYRAGNFKEAETSFSRTSSAEGAFNRGNALVMLGKYAEAVKAYDRALTLRAGWAEAEDNRALALARQKALEFHGDRTGTGGELKPDDIVFDQNKDAKGEEIEVAGGQPLSDEEARSLWLRRVQTRPADFLRAKFAYQARRKKGGAP